MAWKIPLFKTYTDEDDVTAVSKIIRRGNYWATGPEIQKFEETIAKFIGTKYALSFNSWTSGLYTLLWAYGIKGEIIMPSFTFIATANVAVLANCTPVFADIEDETFGLSYEDVRNKITNRTVAVMPIHFAGCPAKDILKIKNLCIEKNILLIEDAAQSLGASIDGKKVGSFGDCGGFSFCQDKVLSTGEGGIAVLNSESIYNKMKLLRSHGRFEKNESDYFSRTDESDYLELGHNFRMPTMCAALGLSQFNKIDLVTKKRQLNAEKFALGLKEIKQIRLPIIPEGFIHVFQKYAILLENKTQRDGLKKYLEDNGIMCKIYFEPLHLKSFLKKNYNYKIGDLPKTEAIGERVLTIPIYADLTDDEINLIIKIIKEYFK